MLLTNRPEFIEIDFALSKTGIVRVPLNARLTGADHHYMLNDSEADLLIFGGRIHRTRQNNSPQPENGEAVHTGHGWPFTGTYTRGY